MEQRELKIMGDQPIRKRLEPVLYFASIHKYIKYRKFHKDLPKSHYNTIRKASKHYVENGGRLYKVMKDGRQRLTLPTPEDQQRALYECHNENNHCGEKRLLLALDAKYYWNSMCKDVKNWLQSCKQCQTSKKKKPPTKELQPIIADSPWQIIGWDVIGPLPTTECENRFIFVTTDVYSKFVYAKPVKHKTPEEICRVIEDLFYTYGPPQRVVIEQGKDFIGRVNRTLLKRWGVKTCIKAPISQEVPGSELDINKNIKVILSKYTAEYLTDWDKYVKQIVYGINASYHAGINRSPFMVMFHREVLVPMYTNIMNEMEFKEKIRELEEVDENSTAIFCYTHDVDHNSALANPDSTQPLGTISSIAPDDEDLDETTDCASEEETCNEQEMTSVDASTGEFPRLEVVTRVFKQEPGVSLLNMDNNQTKLSPENAGSIAHQQPLPKLNVVQMVCKPEPGFSILNVQGTQQPKIGLESIDSSNQRVGCSSVDSRPPGISLLKIAPAMKYPL